MDVTDIGNREAGELKHRKPASGRGVLLTVVRTAQQVKVRFLHAAFNITGESFLAGDHHGNIYAIDVAKLRFHLVQKTGQPCTALAISLNRPTEFLAAFVDNSVRCYDQDTKQMVGWMRGHEGAVSSISIHSSGRFALTTSSETAQLWDLDTFQRRRKLNVHKSVSIQKVFFLPHSNTILSCFSDDSIFAWESSTLVCEYQLPVPDSGPRIFYKAFAVTQDGKTLAAGGRSNLLHLWCLESKKLIKVIQMPTPIRTVRQLEFLPTRVDGTSSQSLGVLGQDGIMRFINIHTSKLLFYIGSHINTINTVIVSPTARFVAAILDDGSISVFSIESLTEDLNKSPIPQVAVVSDNAQNKAPIKLKVKSESIRRPAGAGRQKQVKIRSHTGSAVEDKENLLSSGLNKTRLVSLLKTYGEYPAKYRTFVWRSLLCVPDNYAAYSSLIDRGVHSAYLSLHEKYPIKSPKLQRGLQRVLCALSHWAAIFGEAEYLPLLAFPFVKLFQNNPMLCFEVVATVLVNWCQHWFEYFPNPPLNVLSMAENVLAHHDQELLQHLVDCGITSQLYVWPLLETLFSEVLTRDEWLRLFDNIFSNHPSFLLMACVAYLTCCREPLLLCSHKHDFEYFFHNRNNLDMEAMLKEAYRLMSKTPASIHPTRMLSDLTPLTKGSYPVFNHYPEFIIEYQNQEMEKIRLQEMEYLQERQAMMAIRTDLVQRQAEDDDFYVQQERLKKAEEERRRMLSKEEEKLTVQRKNLAAMKKDLNVKELQMLQENRRRLLKYQQDLQVAQINKLDQEIMRQMELREQESCAAVQDLDIRQMELEVQRRHLEQQLCKEQLRIERQVEDLGKSSPQRENTKMQEEEGVPAKARQLGAERNLKQDATANCLKNVEGQIRRRKLAEGDRLAQSPRDMAGREWDDVLSQRARLAQRQPPSPAADTRPGVNTRRMEKATARPTTSKKAGSNAVCLNNSSPAESTSTNFSLDRGRTQLDRKERQLMKEIKALREKHLARAKEDSLDSSRTGSH
ncbi:TBC1 domain family member 31 [Stigmatopora argus]